MSTVTSASPEKNKRAGAMSRIWDNYGMLVVFAVLFLACALFVPNFASFSRASEWHFGALMATGLTTTNFQKQNTLLANCIHSVLSVKIWRCATD